jgi:hypothetical protein
MRGLDPTPNSPGSGGCGPAQPGRPKAGCPVPSVVLSLLPGSDRLGSITPRTPRDLVAGTVGKVDRQLGKVGPSPGSGGRSLISMACDVLGTLGTVGKVFLGFPMCARDGVGGLTPFSFLTRRLKLPSLPSLPSPKGVQGTETKGIWKCAVALATFPKKVATFPTFPTFSALNQRLAMCGQTTHKI